MYALHLESVPEGTSVEIAFWGVPPSVEIEKGEGGTGTEVAGQLVAPTLNASMLLQTVLITTCLSHHRPFTLPLCVRGTMRAEMLSLWSSQFCFTGKFRVCVYSHIHRIFTSPYIEQYFLFVLLE